MSANNPTAYDFQVAKAALTQVDKDRILAVYLNMTDSNAVSPLTQTPCSSFLLTWGHRSQVNWKKAADDYGSASVESFKIMIRQGLKKIKDAAAKGNTGNSGVTPSPAGGKNKRKAKGAAVASDADDDEETAATPAKKKRGKPAKKAVKAAEGEFFALMFDA